LLRHVFSYLTPFTFFFVLASGLMTSLALAEEKVPVYGVPGTNQERTFIAIKPGNSSSFPPLSCFLISVVSLLSLLSLFSTDGVQRHLIGEIIGRFEKKGFKLVGLKMITPTKEMAEQHYADLAQKPFFGGLVKFFSSGPIVAMVWEGKDAIAAGRRLLGATKPEDSAPGTLRGDYAVVVGRSVLFSAFSFLSTSSHPFFCFFPPSFLFSNIIHGSDGPEGAKAELTMWFKENEINDWAPARNSWVYDK
jgi:nucleoside-diphosphate kinase